MPARFLRLSLRFPALLCLAAALAGCSDAISTVRNTGGVQQAVAQQYDAEQVSAALHQGGGTPRLHVILTNPGGQEATNRQTARTIAQTAQAQYGNGPLSAVRVSFEYTSQTGPAEVGFHRRYIFSAGDLQAAASDTAASDPSPARSADTSAAPQP